MRQDDIPRVDDSVRHLWHFAHCFVILVLVKLLFGFLFL